MVRYCSESEFFQQGRRIARAADAERCWREDDAAIARRDAGLPVWRVADNELDTCFFATYVLTDSQRAQLRAEPDLLKKRVMLQQLIDKLIEDDRCEC